MLDYSGFDVEIDETSLFDDHYISSNALPQYYIYILMSLLNLCHARFKNPKRLLMLKGEEQNGRI